ncbi:MAG: T9SS type A sorting domain-containing protein [Bacteroidales bacterium]|nr:T9SS type A sorting domain-containing protein [Bacteroidales bacterium]
MKKAFFTILIAFFGFGAFATNSYQVDFQQNNPSVYSLHFQLSDYSISEVNLNGNQYSKINFNNSALTSVKGYAELPIINAAVMLSPNRNVDLQIVESSFVEIDLNFPLVPSRGTIYRNQDPSSIPYEIDPASIVDSWYPKILAGNSEPYIVRDIRGTSVYVYPFAYNAAQNKLRIYTSIKVELIENDEVATNPLHKQATKLIREMKDIYSSVFINFNQVRDALSYGENGEILVITTSAYENAIQPYIDWKMEKGFTVHKQVVAVGTNVKSLIQTEYTANNNIFYVLLVGDWADIKCDVGGGASAPMDPQLGCVVGTDIHADICIGRFSANNSAHVTTQVNKTIAYEKNPEMAGTWYTSALGIGSNEGDGSGDDGEMDSDHVDIIYNDKLDPYTYNNHSTAYDPGATAAMVSTAVNAGVGLINYCGHGGPTSFVTTGFSNTNVNALTNGSKLPIIFSVACVNGEFHGSSDCFAEAWLRKDNGGAVFTLMSTINQPWTPPMRIQDYMNDILIGGYDYSTAAGQNGTNTEELRTFIGSIVYNAFVLGINESNGTDDQNTVQTWTSFGDPSLQIRTDVPAALIVSNTVPMVGVDFETNISTAAGLIEGAMVCVSQDGNYFSGITDVNGNVTIPHTLIPGEALLVVTAYNTGTFYETITVASATGPWISYNSSNVNDAAGNNNGLADYSEAPLLGVNARNVGVADATNVIGTISTTNTYITVTDNNHNYGTIAPATTAAGTDGYSINVANNIPDQTNVQFQVSFTDGTDLWESQFFVMMNAPALEIVFDAIDDSGANNNGLLDPGETVNININNLNNGHAASLSSTCVVTSTSPYVTINTGTISPGVLGIAGTVPGVFSVTIDPSTPTGTTVDFTFTLTAGAYSAVNTINLPVGLMMETWESEDFTSYAWENNSSSPWFITTTDPYEGANCAQSGALTSAGGESTLIINIDVLAADDVSFFKKVSCEPVSWGSYYWDYLEFSIDGTSKAKWAGEVAWSQETYAVATGEHELKWAYIKDDYIDEGSDCAWLDGIILPPHSVSTVIEYTENEFTTASLSIYPNPSNAITNVSFTVPNNSNLRLSILNILGKEIKVLSEKNYGQGNYKLSFDASTLPSGVYFCKLANGKDQIVKKVIIP